MTEPEPTGSAVRRRVPWLAAGLVLGALTGLVVVLLTTTASESEAALAAAGAPHYVEQARDAGIDHRYDGDFTYFVGGGVAALDCDGDGKSDLYFAGGETPAALYRNESPIGGELSFTAVPSATTDLTGVLGAYPLDVDGDGITDLAVVRLGENVMLRGLGGCRFERANEAWGIDGGDAWTAAFSATWEQPESLPTLAFGNYLELDESGAATGSCSDNALFRPVAGEAGYGDAITLSPGWCTLSILFSDWSRSGRADLRMANDRHYYRDGEEQLWEMSASNLPPRLYTHEDGWQQMRIWGMGIATQDVTDDGLPEVFLTSQGDSKLQTLTAGSDFPTYGDIAIRRGVTAHRPYTGDDVEPSTAWHPEFQDVNNDGFVDLFISKGNVEAQEGYATSDPNDLLLGQPDGTFVESGEDAGIASFARSRGAALVDFNLDGLLDLVVVNRRENVELYRNVGGGDKVEPVAMGNWISLRLEQDGANRDAIGAWIEVRVGDHTVLHEVTVGGGHASGELGWIHFGLGSAGEGEVRVSWPNGEVGPWQKVDANQFLILAPGADPVSWEPAAE
jgi:hypothetical protein